MNQKSQKLTSQITKHIQELALATDAALLSDGMQRFGMSSPNDSMKVRASASNFVPAPRIAREINSFCVMASRLWLRERCWGPHVWLYQ